ncbi:MAG: glycoside hydrolase family 2 [Clostridiales bacterium]|nr:glycoside hydrolase family 2 [Clostridiales bacterium]
MKLKDAIRTMLFKNKPAGFNQLFTKWGSRINPDCVLPEYPRPQLRRSNYFILNGYWNYSITREDKRPDSFEGKILVPFSPESILSGVGRQLAPGETLWYERELLISYIPQSMRCILHFGAVDQACKIYINNQAAGEHKGGYLPFSLDITKFIKYGSNLITVSVTDLSDSSFHSRGKQKLKRGGMFYTAQSGIWQTVWMEWVPQLYIRSLRITPVMSENLVRIEVFMNDDFDPIYAEYLFFRVDIYDKGRLLTSTVSRLPVINLPFAGYIPWSPEKPQLYDMVITAGEDRVESYFAMRTVEILKDEQGVPRIYLNGKPYFQKGLLDQGYWPDGLYTPPSDEAMVYDIMKAKELGFNMLRKHLKIEPLRWYYHCDRLGMLVWQDMVNGGEKYNMLLVGYLPTLIPKLASRIKDHHYRCFGRKNAEGRAVWLSECAETVELLYNHPSVIVWVLFNEGWGQFDAANAYEMVRRLDPTRLVDHASGWFDQGCGDFVSIHNYFHPLKIKAHNRYPTVLSEYGGYAYYVKEHSYSLQLYGYRLYLSRQDFIRAYRELEERINSLIDKGLAAAVYTQLSDVEDEVNGLLTYDREICKLDMPES